MLDDGLVKISQLVITIHLQKTASDSPSDRWRLRKFVFQLPNAPEPITAVVERKEDKVGSRSIFAAVVAYLKLSNSGEVLESHDMIRTLHSGAGYKGIGNNSWPAKAFSAINIKGPDGGTPLRYIVEAVVGEKPRCWWANEGIKRDNLKIVIDEPGGKSKEAKPEDLAQLVKDILGVDPPSSGRPPQTGPSLPTTQMLNEGSREAPRVSHVRIPGKEPFHVERKELLGWLDDRYYSQDCRVVLIHGASGMGKTAFIRSWLDRHENDWDCPVFAWKFAGEVRTGVNSQKKVTDDAPSFSAFIDEAVKHFTGNEYVPSGEQAYARQPQLLLDHLAKKKGVVVLDGIESMMKHTKGLTEGRIDDDALRNFLVKFSGLPRSFCVVTSHYKVEDLNFCHQKLPPLTREEGANALSYAGVHGPREQLEAAVDKCNGSLLELSLVADILVKCFNGNIDDIEKIDPEHLAGNPYIERLVGRYARLFEEDGRPQANELLRIVSMFRRPVEQEIVGILNNAGEFDGLNTTLKTLSSAKIRETITDVRASPMMDAATHSREPLTMPEVMRGYYRKQLLEKYPDSWERANEVLFHHYMPGDNQIVSPRKRSELELLNRVIMFGCRAGYHAEVFEQVLMKRILRDTELYAVEKLNALDLAIQALTHFYELEDFGRPHPSLTLDQKRMLLRCTWPCLALYRGYGTDDVQKCLLAAQQLVEASDPPDYNEQFTILANLGQFHRVRGQLRESARIAEEELVGAYDLRFQDSDSHRAMAYRAHAASLFCAGRFREAYDAAGVGSRRPLTGADSLNAAKSFVNDPSILAESYRALTAWFLGKVDEAHRDAAMATEKARRLGHGHTIVACLIGEAFLTQFDDGDVLPRSKQLIDTCEYHGFYLWGIFGRAFHAWGLAKQDCSSANVQLDEIAQIIRIWEKSLGAKLYLPYLHWLEADIARRCNEFDRAIASASRGVKLAEESDETWWLADLVRLKEELDHECNGKKRKQTICERAVAISREQGAVTLELRALVAGCAAQQHGYLEAAYRDRLSYLVNQIDSPTYPLKLLAISSLAT